MVGTGNPARLTNSWSISEWYDSAITSCSVKRYSSESFGRVDARRISPRHSTPSNTRPVFMNPAVMFSPIRDRVDAGCDRYQSVAPRGWSASSSQRASSASMAISEASQAMSVQVS